MKKESAPQNVLLLGSGGREFTFAELLYQSPLCNRLFTAPGNAGTAHFGKNVPLGVNDFPKLKEFCEKEKVDMIVVGPEDPLIGGIYDYFADQLPNVAVIGPSKNGAMLEGSKAFAKSFMYSHGIATASYLACSRENFGEGLRYIKQQEPPIVLKADGAALGKGVLICKTREEAAEELHRMIYGKKFGIAGETVLIEKFLHGTEFSVFVLTDGRHYKILPVAKDYKRIGVGDTGLNTGGMGAISPPPFVDEELMKKVEEHIVIPTLAGLTEDEISYKGFIYIGLMNVNGTPHVIEYNCRMGDPETQVVLPRIKSDLLQHLVAVHEGTLDEEKVEISDDAYAAVVLASDGYPGNYPKGKEINLPSNISDDIIIVHAGTKIDGDKLVTNGGRVLAIVASGNTVSEAVEKANLVAEHVSFEGKYYRTDIGFEAQEKLKRKKQNPVAEAMV